MKATLSLLVLLLSGHFLLAQAPEGVIQSTSLAEHSAQAHLPEGLEIYDAPNGNVVGIVEEGKIVKSNVTQALLPELVTADMDYQFFDRRNGYVRFYSQTDHYWIKETDLVAKGYELKE